MSDDLIRRTLLYLLRSDRDLRDTYQMDTVEVDALLVEVGDA